MLARCQQQKAFSSSSTSSSASPALLSILHCGGVVVVALYYHSSFNNVLPPSPTPVQVERKPLSLPPPSLFLGPTASRASQRKEREGESPPVTFPPFFRCCHCVQEHEQDSSSPPSLSLPSLPRPPLRTEEERLSSAHPLKKKPLYNIPFLSYLPPLKNP